MSVTNTSSSASFNGNGVTTEFPLPFRVLEEDDLLVRKLTAGVYTTLVLGVDYSIAGEGPDDGTGTAEGCTITTIGASSPLPNGTSLVVERNTDLDQETTFQPQGQFSPITHSRMADKLTLIAQEHDRRIDVLEALADLVDVTELADGVAVEAVAIAVDPDAPEEEFPQVLAAAGGLNAKHMLLTRIYNQADADERLDGIGPLQWKPGPGANEVTLQYIPGLTPGKTYVCNFLVLF